jgi:ankyrin repeat protein
MKERKVSVLIFTAAVMIFLLPQGLSGQEIKIDTSDYLPRLYDDAIDYNLLVASQKGYVSEIEKLISQGADVEAEYSEGITPIIVAVSHNRLNAVKVLLKNDADPNKSTTKGQTALLIAVKSQITDLVTALRNDLGTNFQFLEIAEVLIRSGADINFQDFAGVTPLNYASIYGLFDFVDLLLYYGADIDKKANDGTSPLMSAIWAGYADIADLLIKNGANIEARDKMGFTPFLVAGQNGDTLMLNHLIKNGVDIYEKNTYGWNALCLAIKTNQKDAVRFLLSKGEKWGDQGNTSSNPYNVAVKYGKKDIIEILDSSDLRQTYRFSLDQMAISAYLKFCPHDAYTGFAFNLKEPLTNIGFSAGADTKLFYTKVLFKESDNLYYQYKDKSTVVYAGLFKEFPLSKKILSGSKTFFTSLNLGYSFGNKFKGTDIAPEEKLKIIPGLGFRFSKNNFIFSASLEYMRTQFTKVGPLWGRIGFAQNFYFDSTRAPGKIIKWY